MKRILARSLLLTLPLTVALIVVGLWVAGQPGQRLSPFIINTRDMYNSKAAIYAYDLQARLSLPVVRYDQNFVGKTAGWSWPVFSGDGRSVAYVRRERGKQWIGVSDSARWQPVEFPAIVPPMAQNTRLTWLPSSRGLLISYTTNDRARGFDTLLGRQLLDLSGPSGNARLVDWPYVCTRLVAGESGLMLRCARDGTLSQNDAPEPSAVVYEFGSGAIQDAAMVDARSLTSLDDILHPNWAYSSRGGLAFFDGGVKRVAVGSSQIVSLPVDVLLPPRLLWSPDGPRLLIEQTDPRTWSVFDLAQNREIMRVGGADIDVTIGYGWYHDAGHIAYVVLPNGQRTETLHVRALDHDEEITLPISARLTDVAWMHP